ncbi:PilZ domain-containing protein [Desulfomicrobium salsuginis]
MIDLHFLQASTDGLMRQFPANAMEPGGHQPEGSFLMTTAALVAAAFLGYALWRRRGGADGGRQRSGITTAPREISAILEQALLMRSRVDASFHPIAASRQTISCSLVDLAPDGVTLEMPLGVTPSSSWIGRLMACYFRIPRENREPYFYTFVSEVKAVHRKGEFHHLVLEIPPRVELGQKRRHLRLELPPRDIKDFRVWPAAEDGSFHFEPDPQKWPAPLATYIRGEHDGMHVLDLSGGGIKLSFDPTRYAGLEDFVSKHPVLFMRLELEPVGGLSVPPYFLAARLRTKTQDLDNGQYMLGYEFVECCSSDGGETIDWVKIEPENGIDELVTWVFKRHLELYREREIV